MGRYELALMGAPSDEQVREVAQCLSSAIDPFGLRLGEEAGWSNPVSSVCRPKQQRRQ